MTGCFEMFLQPHSENVCVVLSAEEEWIQRQPVGELWTGDKKQHQCGENLTQLPDEKRNVTAFANFHPRKVRRGNGQFTETWKYSTLIDGDFRQTWRSCLKEFDIHVIRLSDK